MFLSTHITTFKNTTAVNAGNIDNEERINALQLNSNHEENLFIGDIFYDESLKILVEIGDELKEFALARIQILENVVNNDYESLVLQDIYESDLEQINTTKKYIEFIIIEIKELVDLKAKDVLVRFAILELAPLSQITNADFSRIFSIFTHFIENFSAIINRLHDIFFTGPIITRQSGERLILYMDKKKQIYTVSFARMLEKIRSELLRRGELIP
ncbi:hypothetical protein CDIK_3328 [Cucumispora dikerogammari]|nr:hypothetical protein CDIK_3328 [Cucumispora dikerogammari]